MQKTKLLLSMLALTALLAAVVVFGSPYAPVVAPLMDIEAVWAIEDARVESDAPLVTRLEINGLPLGYDAQANTFYCPIGLENGEVWPDIELTAPGARGVRLCFVDDYAYDWCDEAVREGYTYQILAYTDTAFSYTQIVFTGLPVVSIHTQEEIGDLDVSAQAAFASPEGGFETNATVHLRGAGSRASEKKSYKVDFVHGAKDSAAVVDVPGIARTDGLLLLAGVMDSTLMRERLSWDVYAMIAEADEPYGPRATRYAEVFVNDRYMGCYILMEPVDDVRELQKRSASAPATDSVYRSAQLQYAGDRPYVENPVREGSIYELHHASSQAHAFDALDAYLTLEQLGEEEEEAFEALALDVIDRESMLRYYLFVQACGMSDNVYNNLYMIAAREDAKLTYRFAPWDMDLTWGRFKDAESGEAYHGLFSFGVAQRMIDIDAGGTTREALVQMWRSMRERVFRVDVIAGLIDGYTRELGDSGAYVRDALRWRGEAYTPDGYEIVAFAGEHFAAMDAMIDACAE